MAILMLGKSDTSCGTCHKSASPLTQSHETTYGLVRDKNGKLDRIEVAACGERWEAVQSVYVYPGDQWEEYCRQGTGGFFYKSLLGLPCLDAFGNFICFYGQGLDIQEELPYDG